MNESEPKSDAAPTGGNRSVDGTRTDYRHIVDSFPRCILVADAERQMSMQIRSLWLLWGRSLEDLRALGITDLQVSNEEVVVRLIGKDATVLYEFKKPVDIMERS